MSRIKSRDTAIEIKVRKYLFSKGYRYRKNVKTLPGKPDIVLPKYHTAIFIHGCFWHRHEGCKDATTPGTRVDFWLEKFSKNMANDQRNTQMLKDAGWNVVVLWECDINKRFEPTMQQLVGMLNRCK